MNIGAVQANIAPFSSLPKLLEGLKRDSGTLLDQIKISSEAQEIIDSNAEIIAILEKGYEEQQKTEIEFAKLKVEHINQHLDIIDDFGGSPEELASLSKQLDSIRAHLENSSSIIPLDGPNFDDLSALLDEAVDRSI